MNAIELLESGHETLRTLLGALRSKTPDAATRRSAILDTLCTELEVHTLVEEEIFYPAVLLGGEADEDEALFFDAVEAHRVVQDLVLPDLQDTDMGSPQFVARARILESLVLHHVAQESAAIFPRAKALLSSEELEDLGAEMEARGAELMSPLLADDS